MVTVIGVRFRAAGKIYYFSPGKLEIKNGDHVIVETARGIEYGHVVLGNRDVEDNKVVQPLKAVIRMANKEDIMKLIEDLDHANIEQIQYQVQLPNLSIHLLLLASMHQDLRHNWSFR